MSDVIETVDVVREDSESGFITINKSDMTEEDELYEAEVETEEGTAPNEGTVAWYEMKLTEMEVDFSEAGNKADLLELYELNLTELSDPK